MGHGGLRQQTMGAWRYGTVFWARVLNVGVVRTDMPWVHARSFLMSRSAI